MIKSKLLKYVASPQTFAYMPPVLAGMSVGGGMTLWFMGQMVGFGILPGLITAIVACTLSAYAGFKDPHISNMMIAKQAFMKKTPTIIPTKGKQYVG
jgi:hypothetical protein